MMFLSRLFSRRKMRRDAVARLEQCLNRQSRQEVFFSADRISDTLDGRFESLTIHTALLIRRLRETGDEGKARAELLTQKLFSTFDHALRETGTSDLSVARKIRLFAEAWYGRMKAYDAALSSGEGLNEVLARNLLTQASEAELVAMEKYVLSADQHLAKQSDEAVLNGEITWPDPSAFF